MSQSPDQVPKTERRWWVGIAVVGVGIYAALFALGYSGAEKPSGPKASITLTPDLSGFLKDPSTCLNGGSRPCAVVIRSEPKRASSYVNADPSSTARVVWPSESYGGQEGDYVAVNCYVADGEKISDDLGDPASTDWYQVVVPGTYVVNPALRGPAKVLGYASVEWFHQSVPARGVPRCRS